MKLAATGLAVQLGERRLLIDVSLAIAPGELVLVAGRNGSGKSTLLRMLLGAQRADQGQVLLGARALCDWPARERARQVAFVPQQPDCPFDFRARELVAMGRHPHDPGERDAVVIHAAMRAVDADAFADRPVTSLSGGELRRVAVARALATEAPLLLLDEPTSNLDLEHALVLAGLMQRLAREGRGLLVATHDLNLLAPFADRVVLLHDGRVHADGAPVEVLSAANFATVFRVTASGSAGYFPRTFTRREQGL
ncbi:MAG: ABC transporter ATP-binding protein [Planctomycetota bacterium]|nr:ABC transporter ATP-binding protein [Planctomycetota bacterium]